MTFYCRRYHRKYIYDVVKMSDVSATVKTFISRHPLHPGLQTETPLIRVIANFSMISNFSIAKLILARLQ